MSQTYKEGHASNVLLTRMKGDPKVNHALDDTSGIQQDTQNPKIF